LSAINYDAPPFKLCNFIDGKFIPPANNKYFDNINPATGKVYSYVPDSDATDVELAVRAAKKAFPEWSARSNQDRAAFLNRIADLIEQHLKVFAEAESRDQGKPVTLATAVDIPRAVQNFRFYASAILHHTDLATHTDNLAVNFTIRTPLGVAGLISPWNLPLYLLTWKIAPAIAVGNTAVCKPSEMTSVTASMLGHIFNLAGLPPGVCNIVMGGPTAAEGITRHPEIPLISFTGGTVTGEKVLKAVTPYYKKVSLELGGKNPNIIFADADLNECVATSVRSSFSNQGEICLCGSRIFVQQPLFEKFVSQFSTAVSKLVVGDPRDPNTNIGALISQTHQNKVQSYIDLAVEEGGQIILGGGSSQHAKNPLVASSLPEHLRGGYFINPTIIEMKRESINNSRVMKEEIFGPVVTITPFESESEVIEYANSVQYGLSASLWTKDVQRALRISQQIHAGTVWVNCWMLRDLRVPFGGVKNSGLGREGGEYSIDFYTELKTVCLKL